jgi:hypothetical protein
VTDQAGTDWFILRCANKATLALASSLSEDGFESYAPTETIRIIIPKMNVRRFGKKALLPGFVFVRKPHLVDLLELERMPVKPRRGADRMMPAHRGFRVIRSQSGVSLAPDAQLNALREIESMSARKVPKPKATPLPSGARAKVGQGSPYTGMHGTVRRSNGNVTIVCFGGWMERVEIETSLLSLDEAYSSEAADRKAA